MPNPVALYLRTVAKFREPKPDVFFYGGCQKTRMPLRFVGTALLNRTLIVDRIECAEVFPDTGTSSKNTAGFVYEGDITLRDGLTCPYCGPSGFVCCGSCGHFNCLGADVDRTGKFCCAYCGMQAGMDSMQESSSVAAALHIDKPAPALSGFDDLWLEGPKARPLLPPANPPKRLRLQLWLTIQLERRTTMQGSFGPRREPKSGDRPSHNPAPTFKSAPPPRQPQRGPLFWISEPFIGKARRETPARYAYEVRSLGVMLVGGWLAVRKLLDEWTGQFDTHSLTYGLIICAVICMAWDSLDAILFDPKARHGRRHLKIRAPLPRYPDSPANRLYIRANYQHEQFTDLVRCVVFAGLLFGAASLSLVADQQIQLIIERGCILAGVAALFVVALPAAENLLFGGYEVMVEEARQAGVLP